MATGTVVSAIVDGELEARATAIYAEAGLTLSQAFRLLLVRTVADRKVPFDPLIPNAETVEALQEAENGQLNSFSTIEGLLADLNAPD